MKGETVSSLTLGQQGSRVAPKECIAVSEIQSFLIELVSRAQPHRVAVFLLSRRGCEDNHIFEQFSHLPLRKIWDDLGANDADQLVDGAPVAILLSTVSANLGRRLTELIDNRRLRERYEQVLDSVIGETSLTDYYSDDPVEDITWWRESVEELFLIARARAGDERAFGALHARHKKAVYGAIRARLDSDDDAEDVEQQTWAEIWQKLATYDPRRADSFVSFVKYWAGIMVLRWFDSNRTTRAMEITFSSLLQHYPEMADDDDVTRILERAREKDNPEEERKSLSWETCQALEKVAFESPFPPHHILAFGFCVLLKLKPQVIVAEFSTIPLRRLVLIFEQKFLDASKLPQAMVAQLSHPVKNRMDSRVKAFVTEPKTVKAYNELRTKQGLPLMESVIGDTTFEEYFTKKGTPTGHVTSWWFTVQRRLQTDLAKNPPPELLEEGRPLLEALRKRKAARKPRRPRKR